MTAPTDELRTQTRPAEADPETPDAPSVEVDPSKRGARAARPARRARLKRWGVRAAIALPVVGAASWIAVHRIPWLGPIVSNSLRAVLGTENVTALQDFVYGIEDDINQVVKKDEKPKAYWKVPPKAATAPAPAPEVAEKEVVPAAKALTPFAPAAPGPVHDTWSAEGDGEWVPIVDPRHPNEPPRMMKTLLHPDRNRSWAELFVVAIDLRQVEVHPVAGTREPASENPEAENLDRPGKIPESAHDTLLAAFNGGFMAEHGQYGMKLDGVTLLEPRPDSCTLAELEDGSLRVGTWKKIASDAPKMTWFRQAPNCMYEDDKLHPLLAAKRPRKWGATLDGNTVIRRSAVGLSATGDILYMGITNHTTARALADGMHHAGAVTVAQMDVNWSYPKFVTYEPTGGKLKPIALADGFEFSEDLYIRERSLRDFFYLTRKDGASKKAPAESSVNDASPNRGTSPSGGADPNAGLEGSEPVEPAIKSAKAE